MMKEKTMERIVKNAIERRKDTVIGKYTYRWNPFTGRIKYCLTEDKGRMFIDADGNKLDCWKQVR